MIKVACVGIIEKNNKVLLTKRGVSPFKFQYVMPGGKLDIGESVFECVKREVEEEVGLKVINSKLFDVYEVFFDEVQYLILYFICNVENFNIKIDNVEVVEVAWADKETFQDYNITEGTNYILSKFFKVKSGDLIIGIKDFRL